MKDKISLITALSATLVTASLVACGGSGGDAESVTAASLYTGSTTAITLDNTNATDTLASVFAVNSSTAYLPMLKADQEQAAPLNLNSVLALVKETTANLGSGVSAKPIIAGVAITETLACDVSGSISLTGNIANENNLSVGDSLTVTYSNCKDYPSSPNNNLNGSMSITFTLLEGDYYNWVPPYKEGITAVFDQLSITDSGVSLLVHGDMSMVDGETATTQYTSGSGSALYMSMGAEAVLMTNFNISAVEDDVASTMTDVLDMTIASTALGGSITVETTTAVVTHGADPYPTSGSMTVTGANGTKVKFDVIDNQAVNVSLDVDPIDGVYEVTNNVAWSAL